MPSRRDYLRTVTAGTGLSALAGCGLLSGGSPVLSCVSVVNEQLVAHTVHVVVERAGELVAWQALHLDAATADTVDEAIVARTWPTEPAPFLVRARLDDRDEWHELDSGEFGAGDAVHARLYIQDEGPVFYQNVASDPSDQCPDAPVATDTGSAT